MAHPAQRDTDERLNELSDKDQFWGPLLSFRPEKRDVITSARALAITATLGSFYGMLLNLILALMFRHGAHQLPRVFVMPTILTLTYFAIFQFTLRPAWNRRAHWMVRREGYLQSIGRTPNEQ
jgi:hypothetical protein